MRERENLPSKMVAQDKVVTTIQGGSLVARGLQAVENSKQTVLTKNNEVNTAEEQYRLGVKYYDGDGVPQVYEEAAKWYRKAADQGHEKAQLNLGNMYYVGRGVAKDEVQAIHWVRKAAEQGYAPGQVRLGHMYHCGRRRDTDIEKNDEQIVYWYRKAAEQGDADGQCALGEMYNDGRGVPQDYAEALRWFRKAAEQDNAGGYWMLGRMYSEGRGVAQDNEQAEYWFRKEVEKYVGLEYGGDWGKALGAWYDRLGEMYKYGVDEAEQNDELAFYWLRKAAEQGNASGQCELGGMYEFGKGVAKDFDEAVK